MKKYFNSTIISIISICTMFVPLVILASSSIGTGGATLDVAVSDKTVKGTITGAKDTSATASIYGNASSTELLAGPDTFTGVSGGDIVTSFLTASISSGTHLWYSVSVDNATKVEEFTVINSGIPSTPASSSGSFGFTFHVDNPIKSNTILDFINHLLGIIFKIGIPIVSLFIIWAGFQYIAARGNEKKITVAHANLKYVLIGTALFFGAYTLGKAIVSIVNKLV